MLTDEGTGLIVCVHLHLEGRALEINPDSFGITSGKIKVSRPRALDEYGVAAGRKIKRSVNRRGRFHDHVHLLATQIESLLDAVGPRRLLRAVNDTLHQPRVVFVVQSVHSQTPSDNARLR